MFGFRRAKDNTEAWPNDDEGNPIPPVFLIHIHGGPLDMELTLNLLGAYGVPYLTQYPNNGSFGKIIMGHSPMGADVYVPETMLEEAQDLLSADIIDDDEDVEAIE